MNDTDVSDAFEVNSVGESICVTSLSACRHEHVVMAYLQNSRAM